MRAAVTQRLIQDHRNIERVLMLMRLQLDCMGRRDGEALTLLSNAANYLIHYPCLLHHPLEEEMIEQAVETGSSEGAAALLVQLKGEHAAMTSNAADLVAQIGLQQLRFRHDMPGLRQHGDAFILDYDKHIRFEEQQIIPLAQAALSDAQWGDLGRKFVTEEDPLFGRKSRALFDNLYDALMGETARVDH